MNRKTLSFILLISFILRIAFLFHHDVWFDEAISILFSRLSVKNLLLAASFDNNPPFYYLLLHFWMKISADPTWLRLLSLLFSLSSLITTYLLAKKLYNQKTANLALAFISLMPVQLYHSGEIRYYSLITLLSTLTLLFTVGQKKQQSSKYPSLLLIGSSFALLSTHYYGYFVVAIIALFILKTKKKLAKKNILLALIFSLILTLPWLLFSLNKPHPHAWTPNPLLSLIFTPIAATFGLVGITSPSSFTALAIIPLLIILSLALLIFIPLIISIRKKILIYLIFIFTLYLTASLFPFFSPRLIIPFSPLIYILLASILTKKPNLTNLYLSLLLCSSLLYFVPFLKGQNIQQVMKLAQTNELPVIHTSPTTFFPAIALNYPHQLYAGLNVFPKELNKLIGSSSANIQNINHTNYVTLLIDSHNTDNNNYINIIEQLNYSYILTSQKSINGLVIQYYLLKSS